MFIEAIKQNKVKMSGMAWAWSVSQRYIIGGPETRMPSDFKLFLANDDNKTQLCILLRGLGQHHLPHSGSCGRQVISARVVRWQREYMDMIYL